MIPASSDKQDLSDAIGRYVAGSMDLSQLCDSFRATLTKDPSQRQSSAAWLTQCSEGGRLSPAVCQSLREVLASFEPPEAAAATRVREFVAAAPVPASPRLSVGSFLGADHRYELQVLLGEGGMGQVFKARDHFMDSTVALKVLGERFSQHPDAYKSLQNETRRAQELEAPNVVKVFNFDHDGPIAFMIMEYLEGKSLEQTLRERNNQPMTVAQAWPILNAIGTALAAAHEQKLVHSDLKPGNVFVCSKGGIKVLDFGIARQYRTPTDVTIGSWSPEVLGAYSPPYASLEQIQGLPADPRDDIYAFGCLAYRLLSGAHPFGEASADLAFGSKLAPNHLDQLSSRQWHALRHALAFKRNDRTANLRDFLREFAPPSALQKYRLPILVGALTLVGGLAYLLFVYLSQKIEKDNLPRPAAPGNHRPLPPDQQHSVDDALFLAKDYLSGAKVTDDANDLEYTLSEGANNVNDILDSVLKTDPGNPQALQMKKAIASLYLQKARLEMGAHHNVAAATLIRDGRKAEPDSVDLYRLEQQLCNSDPAACALPQN